MPSFPRFVPPARPARRRFLKGVAAFVMALPVLRSFRVDAADYVERDGWILKRSDVEREGGR